MFMMVLQHRLLVLSRLPQKRLVLPFSEQQKALLMGQTVALFISQVLLAGTQGDRIEPEQVKAGGVATFFSILIAVLGQA